MRRGFYIVLMVMLVLRGLAGTAMAAGVMPVPHQQVPACAQGDGNAHGAVALAVPSTHHHVGASEQAGGQDPFAAPEAAHSHVSTSCAAQEHHSTACSACDICHSTMLDAPRAPTPVFSPAGVALPLPGAPFDSAPTALALKPPIA